MYPKDQSGWNAFWFFFGCFLGALFISLFLLAPTWDETVAFFEDFQTIIAGSIAFIGAALTVRAIYHEIEMKSYFESVSTATYLPIALSDIIADVSLKICDIEDAISNIPSGKHHWKHTAEINRSAISALQKHTPFTKEKMISFKVLVNKIQITESRLDDIYKKGPSEAGFEMIALQRIWDLVEIYSICDDLFLYCRSFGIGHFSRNEDLSEAMTSSLNPSAIANTIGILGLDSNENFEKLSNERLKKILANRN